MEFAERIKFGETEPTAVGSGRANKFFQNVDQPARRMQYRQALRQFFFAVNVIEQFLRSFIRGVRLCRFAEQMEPGRQLGAATFKLIVALTKGWPRGALGRSGGGGGAAGHGD